MKKRIISIVSVILVVAMLSVVLVACAPKDAAAAEEKMKGKEYEVSKVGNSVAFAKEKDDNYYAATAYFFEDKEKLDEAFKKYDDEKKEALEKSKEFRNSLQEDLDNLKKKTESETVKGLIKDLEKQIKKLDDQVNNYEVKKSGNWVLVGHKKAIGDFLGM